ncbi:MAG: superoxide dismutase, Ni [Gammaproteobacteria bacterium]|nr:MAG: superoxide dismutase, Ni [Gammaproteobacteria bacterium]
MLRTLVEIADKTLGFEKADAHCDIPCGVYDPASAQIAALSVIRFMDLIQEVADREGNSAADQAQLARLAIAKEAEAVKVKEEVRIIWGDYFKAPQFEKYPNTNELVHSIMMAASACKQGIERAKGEKLLALVNEFAASFWDTKGVETYEAECPYPPSMPVVYPKLG